MDTLYVYWQRSEGSEPVLVDTVEYPDGRPDSLDWYAPSLEDIQAADPPEWDKRGGIYHFRWNDDPPVTLESLQAAADEQAALNL